MAARFLIANTSLQQQQQLLRLGIKLQSARGTANRRADGFRYPFFFGRGVLTPDLGAHFHQTFLIFTRRKYRKKKKGYADRITASATARELMRTIDVFNTTDTGVCKIVKINFQLPDEYIGRRADHCCKRNAGKIYSFILRATINHCTSKKKKKKMN